MARAKRKNRTNLNRDGIEFGKAKRLRELKAQGWISEGWSRAAIVSKMCEEYKYPAARAVKDIENAVKNLRSLQKQLGGPVDYPLFRMLLLDTVVQARNDGRFGAAISGFKLLADIEGFTAQDTGTVQLPPEMVKAYQRVMNLTPAQRRKRKADLDAKGE